MLSGTLTLADACNVADCSNGTGTSTDRLISRIIAGGGVIIDIAITPVIETNVDNTDYPQIVNQVGVLDCTNVECFLGTDTLAAYNLFISGGGTALYFDDTALTTKLGATTSLIITQNGDVDIILDMNGSFVNSSLVASTLVIQSAGDIFDVDTGGTAFSGKGLSISTTGGAIGSDSDGTFVFDGVKFAFTPDGTLTLDVSDFTVSNTGGNDVGVTSAGTTDTVYAINTGGAGDIIVGQFNNDLLIGGTGISTTGTIAMLSLTNGIELDPLAPTGVITGDKLALLARTGIGAVSPIATSVNTLSLFNTISGAINIVNSGTTTSLEDWTGIGGGSAIISAGNLDLSSQNSISQVASNNVDITGTTTLTSTTGAITLGETTNDFVGAVTASAATNVVLGDANSILVDSITATSGDVSLTALTGAINVLLDFDVG